jgi:hypothetical protein
MPLIKLLEARALKGFSQESGDLADNTHYFCCCLELIAVYTAYLSRHALTNLQVCANRQFINPTQDPGPQRPLIQCLDTIASHDFVNS